MTADQAFYAFSSISIAAVLLALIVGFGGFSPKNFASASLQAGFVSKRKQKGESVMRKTEIADAAMAARARGERFVPPSDYSNP